MSNSPFAFAGEIWQRHKHWKAPGFQQDWRSFVAALGDKFSTMEGRLGAVEKRPIGTGVGGSGDGSGSGTGDGKQTGGVSPSVAPSFEPVLVANTLNLQVGQLVNYRHRTLRVASNASVETFANYAVGSADKQFARLYQVWVSGSLLMASGRGGNADGVLYLATGGRVTDVASDIEGANGYGANGAVIKQVVGYSQGFGSVAIPRGTVRCSLNLYNPYAILG